MKTSPGWLRLLGILAVGFVIGRFTAQPTVDAVPMNRPVISGDDPVVVPMASVPVATSEAQADRPDVAAQLTTELLDEVSAAVPPVAETGSEASSLNAEAMTADGQSTASEQPTARPELAAYVGTWFAKSHGTRLTKLNADGTGHVHAKLDWIASLLYGSELHIDVAWTVEGDLMTHTVISGSPEKNLNALIRDYGAVKDYRIESIDESTMTLVDPTDGEVIVWHRRDGQVELD